jgi:ADP-ribosylglycohydrolase
MRAAPVGVLFSSGRMEDLTRGAYACAIPTHGGQLAVCAAAAVAGAVSAALEGRTVAEVLTVALAASREAENLRPSREAGTMTQWLAEVYSSLAARKHLVVDELADQYFPDRPRNIVPLAISLALVTRSARETALLAANIGGDADSVASIGGAIAGALWPETVDPEWCGAVRAVNGDELVELATALAEMRR